MSEAPSRSTGKRQAVTQEGAATDEGVDAVIANEELESSVKVRSKKQRRTDARKPPFETIPVDLLPTIMLFLDARDVYNLSNCSKRLRNAVTPEVVVHSAVLGGFDTRFAIEEVMKHVKTRSIHVPSTLRLLRLVNAKKCERMEDCAAYDLVKHVSGDCFKDGIRPFGLSICPDCVESFSLPVVPPPRNGDHFAHNDRVASQNSRLLHQPHTEVATGERAGPFVFAKTVLQIQNTSAWKEKEEKRKQALANIVKQIDETTPSGDEARAAAFLDAYKTADKKFVAKRAKRHAAGEKGATEVTVDQLIHGY